MTQEDKELLLRYFSIALPYGLKMQNLQEDCPVELCGINLDSEKIRYYTYKEPSLTVTLYRDLTIQEKLQFKPYLRPLVSMTEKERYEIQEILGKDVEIFDDFINIIDSSRKRFSFLELQMLLNWLNIHHFDFIGLIPKGLAIEVTEENNPYKD